MNIQEMMKQAQAMQGKMQELQEKLAEIEVEGEAGGGMVKIVMTCKGEVSKIDIDPSIIDASEKETLEDLIAAALNKARNNADERMAEESRKLMQEMGLPAGMASGGLPGM